MFRNLDFAVFAVAIISFVGVNAQPRPLRTVRVAILTDPFKPADGPSVFTKETMTTHFNRAVRANNLTIISRFLDGRIVAGRQTNDAISIQPFFMAPGDNRKMKEEIEASPDPVVALLEVSTCSTETCNYLNLLAHDLRQVTIFSTCCYIYWGVKEGDEDEILTGTTTESPSQGEVKEATSPAAVDNFIYLGVQPSDVAGFILALKRTYRWRRFHFIISPDWPSYDHFYGSVATLLSQNDSSVVLTHSFFCSRYLATGHVCNWEGQAKEIVLKQATAVLMLLDKNEDLPDFLYQLQQLYWKEKNSLSNGKAYFLINHSGLTVVRSGVKAFRQAPDGLMLLRRNFLKFQFDEKDNITKMAENYDLHRYLWQFLRPIVKAAEAYEQDGGEFPQLFCDSIFQFDDSDQHVVYPPVPCRTSLAEVQILNIINPEDSSKFTSQPCIVFNGSHLNLIETPIWPGSGYNAPKEDFCLLDGNDCPSEPPNYTVIIAPTIVGFFAVIGITVLIAAIIVSNERKRKQQADLLFAEIVADFAEIEFQEKTDGDSRSKSDSTSIVSSGSSDTRPSSALSSVSEVSKVLQNMMMATAEKSVEDEAPEAQTEVFNQPIKVRFRGDWATVTRLKKASCNVDSVVVQELVETRNLRHLNVNPFLAVTNNPYRIYYIQGCCFRGTLQEVLQSRKVQLDKVFKMSFASDIAAGMAYIHRSPIGSHGRIGSESIFVDSRWYCRVGNIPLPRFEASGKEDEICQLNNGLYTAPELLSHPEQSIRGTKKGDVYAYGIVLQEIIMRSKPFSMFALPQDVILKKIRVGTTPPLRPKLPKDDDEVQDLCDLAKLCWEEIPLFRPNFDAIAQILKKFNNGKDANLIDQMTKMQHEQADRLEHLVEEQTAELNEERKKSEELLSRNLPICILQEFGAGRSVEAEHFESVTVYFSNIVGFNKLTNNSSPIQIVDFLNDLNSHFDAIIDAYDVYKVAMVSDGYMVCSGLPQRNGNRHASEIATMALDILSCVDEFQVSSKSLRKCQIRCGIDTGPIFGGVVGLSLPRYLVFGQTVNIAKKMESSCPPMRIQISTDCKNLLDKIAGFVTVERSDTKIVDEKTYFLVGKNGFVKVLPCLDICC